MIPVINPTMKLNDNDSILDVLRLDNGCLINHKDFIKKWNNVNAFDRWWRKKYKVPFGSEQHLNMNHIFMSMEFKEDTIFDSKKHDSEDLKEKSDNILIKAGISPKSTNTVVSLKGKELDNEFDNLNLNEFNG